MPRQSGVISDTAAARSIIDIKRAALLYDRIIILRTKEGEIDRVEAKSMFGLTRSEQDWLTDTGLIEFQVDTTNKLLARNDSGYAAAGDEFIRSCRHYKGTGFGQLCLLPPRGDGYENTIRSAANFSARFSASALQGELDDERFLSICYPLKYQLSMTGAKAVDPYSIPKAMDYEQTSAIVLTKLPVPSEITPWEAIIDFRNDPHMRQAFLGLRNWMSDVGKSGVSRAEVSERLEYQILKIEDELKRARIEYTLGQTETLVSGTFALIENLLKLNLKDAAGGLFSVAKNRIALLEKEAKIAESGLYYIVKANEKFGS